MTLSGLHSLKISVRSHPKFGWLNHSVNAQGFWPAEPVILIHGFNTDEYEAEEGYYKMMTAFKRIGLPQYQIKRIGHFYWPGNTYYTRNFTLISKVSYPYQIRKARDAAKLFAEHLIKTVSAIRQITFIAHSLGCRMVLEMVKAMLDDNTANGVRIKLIALMAAAIPVRMMDDSSRPLHKIRIHAKSIACVYSPRDTTLKIPFLMGQFAGGESYGFSEAIGSNGDPRQFWTAGSKDAQINHNDYWEDENVARFLAHTMRIPAPAQLPLRRLAIAKTFR